MKLAREAFTAGEGNYAKAYTWLSAHIRKQHGLHEAEENHLHRLKPGENTAHVYDGDEDSAKVYRHHKGHYVFDNNKYDHEEPDADKMHGYLKKRGYRHVGVDSVYD